MWCSSFRSKTFWTVTSGSVLNGTYRSETTIAVAVHCCKISLPQIVPVLQMKLASDVVKCCKLQEPLTTVVRADISGFRADQNDRVMGRSCEVLDAHASALDTMSTQVWVEQVTSSYRSYIGVCALPGRLTRASAIGSIGCSFNGGGGRNDAYQQKLQTDPMASQINQPLCVLQVTAVTQRIQVIEGALWVASSEFHFLTETFCSVKSVRPCTTCWLLTDMCVYTHIYNIYIQYVYIHI